MGWFFGLWVVRGVVGGKVAEVAGWLHVVLVGGMLSLVVDGYDVWA